MLPRRERRSGKENIRRQHPMHINARIQATTTTIAISMVTPNISVGRYIQRTIKRIPRRGTC
jgi:hypothetical protein